MVKHSLQRLTGLALLYSEILKAVKEKQCINGFRLPVAGTRQRAQYIICRRPAAALRRKSFLPRTDELMYKAGRMRGKKIEAGRGTEVDGWTER